jgi:serpin B
MDSAYIFLHLPKWQYAYSIEDMKPHLTQLGMGIAFGDHADLSNMYPAAPGSLQVSRAIHKTFIKVSEEGTEAAAVTAISVGPTAVLHPIVSFDHPFLYVLREKQAGIILFIGIVNDPTK